MVHLQSSIRLNNDLQTENKITIPIELSLP